MNSNIEYSHTAVAVAMAALVILLSLLRLFRISPSSLFSLFRRPSLYVVDFECWESPDSWRVSTEEFLAIARDSFRLSADSVSFCARLLASSGLGERTALPPAIVERPSAISIKTARQEIHQVVFPIIDALFERHNLTGASIDHLIVCCSLFCPTPSIASMIVNRYKMKENINSYNISGMGCSASLIGVSLAQRLLAYEGGRCLLVTTENITQNIYLGQSRSMLVSNCLFRCGGCAALLSGQRPAGGAFALRLLACQRVDHGADDESFNSVVQVEDEEGHVGVRLSKELDVVAERAIKANLTRIGPHCLSWRELARCAWLRLVGAKMRPNFSSAISHYAIHAGGLRLLQSIGSALGLSDSDLAPSRAVLRDRGNVSSSSVWYEMAHVRKAGQWERGQRVLMVALGAGFKCNTAVWEIV